MNATTTTTKKYLCAAPRPNEWHEWEDAVLTGLGSKAQAVQILESTLTQLQTKYKWHPKTGPGRKSNAEHAIHFYQYLLDKVRQEQQDEGEEEEDATTVDQDNSKGEEEETENEKEDDDGEEKEENDNNNNNMDEMETTEHTEDDYEEKQDTTTTVHPRENPAPTTTSTTQPPAQVKQTEKEAQETVCNVCLEQETTLDDNNGTTTRRLLACTTCPRVFHLPCVRPVLTEFPSVGEWKCAYCVLSSEPKNSKKRRDSAAAVRLMARLRNGIQRRKRNTPRPQPQQEQVPQEQAPQPPKEGEDKEETERNRQDQEKEKVEPVVETTTTTTVSEQSSEQVQEQGTQGATLQPQQQKDPPKKEDTTTALQSFNPDGNVQENAAVEEPVAQPLLAEHKDFTAPTSAESTNEDAVVDSKVKTNDDNNDNDKTSASQPSTRVSETKDDPEAKAADQDKTTVEEDKEETAKDTSNNVQQPNLDRRPPTNDTSPVDAEKAPESKQPIITEKQAAPTESKDVDAPESQQQPISTEKSSNDTESMEVDATEATNSNKDAPVVVVDSKPRSASPSEDDNQPMDSSLRSTTNNSNKKRNLELSKLSNTWTGQVESPEQTGRGKRHRKQPTLYDPQLVPARNWQSDEVHPSEDTSSTETVDEVDEEEAEAELVEGTITDTDGAGEAPSGETKPSSSTVGEDENRAASTGEQDEPRCGFCLDDPSIVICCFCGCRKCFGKRDQDKLLLCDECDDEYHIYCLDPPLTEIPTLDKWYCPSCTLAKSKQKAVAQPSTTITAKRKVGRPPSSHPSKVGRPSSSTVSSSKTTSSRVSSPSRKSSRVLQEEEEPPRRRRGRPPKNANAAAPSSRSSSPKKGTGRKRGRPPKNKPSPSPPRKQSKPPVRSSDGRFMSPQRGGGRSSSVGRSSSSTTTTNTYAAAKSSATAQAVPAPTPVIVSRSGRTVKRSSFHDEIDEGEQHLKLHQHPGRRSSVSNSGSKKSSPQERSLSAKRSSITAPVVKVEETTDTPEQDVLNEMDIAIAASTLSEDVPMPLEGEPVADPNDPIPVPGAPPVTEPSTSTAVATTGLDTTTLATVVSLPGISAEATTTTTTTADGSAAVAVASVPTTTTTANTMTTTAANTTNAEFETLKEQVKVPRRKPGARECMQISRRFGVKVIPTKYIEILTDYCKRGKVEHLIRMRERLDEHSRFLESQLAGLEALVQTRGESTVVVPPLPEGPDKKLERTMAGDMFDG